MKFLILGVVFVLCSNCIISKWNNSNNDTIILGKGIGEFELGKVTKKEIQKKWGWGIKKKYVICFKSHCSKMARFHYRNGVIATYSKSLKNNGLILRKVSIVENEKLMSEEGIFIGMSKKNVLALRGDYEYIKTVESDILEIQCQEYYYDNFCLSFKIEPNMNEEDYKLVEMVMWNNTRENR